MSKTKKKKTTLGIQIDEELKQQVKEYCEAIDEPMSRLLRRLLKEEMMRNPIEKIGGKEDGTSK